MSWQQIYLLRDREKRRDNELTGVRWGYEINVLAAQTLFSPCLFCEQPKLLRLSCRFLSIRTNRLPLLPEG